MVSVSKHTVPHSALRELIYFLYMGSDCDQCEQYTRGTTTASGLIPLGSDQVSRISKTESLPLIVVLTGPSSDPRNQLVLAGCPFVAKQEKQTPIQKLLHRDAVIIVSIEQYQLTSSLVNDQEIQSRSDVNRCRPIGANKPTKVPARSTRG